MELQAMHEVGGACEWFLFDGKNFREFQGGNTTGLLNFVKASSFWYNCLFFFKNTFCYDNRKICNYCATTQPV